jgi:RHS repeat-associated protein
MPFNFRKGELCRYRYDPLDQQTGYTVAEQDALQRFYCKNRLVTQLQGALKTSILRHEEQPLAQQRRQISNVDTSLLAIDLKNSVLEVLAPIGLRHPAAYTPYGHHQRNGLLSLPGFNGELPDPLTGCYHLGNGYRQYNPLLLRFHSPDNMSPFGKGGLNAYAYCEGEPVMRSDPDGHFFKSFSSFFSSYIMKPLQNLFTSRQSSSSVARQMRRTDVVRLDGQAIKIPADIPDVPIGTKNYRPGIGLKRIDYKKLNKLKLELDQYTTKLKRENITLSREQNWSPDLQGRFKYQYQNAKGRPMEELLDSIKRMDAAELQNRMLSVRNPSRG